MVSRAIREQPSEPLDEEAVVAAVAGHDFFAPGVPVLLARAPGRLDVMGGNVDYTGGMVLQGLLRESVWAACQRRGDGSVRLLNPGAASFGWKRDFELPLASLEDPAAIAALCSGAAAFWGRYVLGAVCFLLRHGSMAGNVQRGGLDLFLLSDLPPNKGVSSSAALVVASLRAMAAAWDIPLDGVALATAAQWVENVVAGAACGIMDQAAIVLGREDHLLPILCQPCLPSPPLKLPPGVCLWGLDSMTPRSTTGHAYERARAAAFMGYRILCANEGLDVVHEEGSAIPRWTDVRWNGYLSNLAVSEFRSRHERTLPESMRGSDFLAGYREHVDPFTQIDPDAEYPVRAAVRYAVEENLRVQRVHALLGSYRESDAESTLRQLGEIFLQSHHAYAECGLGAEACDELVRRALQAGLPGAKMTGGGAGGVVVLLGRPEDREKALGIAELWSREHGADASFFRGSSDGVDAFGTRILRMELAGAAC
ncbi:L-arabinokinase [Bryocella elongata]|uniref:L-arabinokinase n=1 Tax=Bryocella elongata TaxID=863522 RepID=A0A1H6C0W8_9BACT|nr:galactokinase family protein [Bryocella elongata]SEG66367.1 L-arabinokinase [Bryocella elongata]